MSKVALSGNASGTGTFTIASPNSNTDRTLSLPDASGTILTTATAGVPVNGPAFSAYQSSAQSLTGSVWTKIQFQTEEYDTASAFDSTTNYRFLPTVAGYYLCHAGVTPSAATVVAVYIYKNGSAYKIINNGGGVESMGAGGCMVYLNGSTDYVEVYALIGSTQNLAATSQFTYFQGAMIRSAT